MLHIKSYKNPLTSLLPPTYRSACGTGYTPATKTSKMAGNGGFSTALTYTQVADV